MHKARLELNYSGLDIGAESLANLIADLPDRKDASEVYEDLAGYPFARVREAIARKEHLTDATVMLLEQDASRAVLIALLNNDAANARIAKSRIEELIAVGDTELLLMIFQNVKNMTQLDAAHIYHRFAIHRDAALRLEVARSSDTSSELLHRLARDPDPDVRDAALATIQDSLPSDDDLV